MILAGREITEAEMLLDWARAEPEAITRVAPDLGQLAAHAATGAPLSNEHAGLMIGGILAARGVFVGHFVAFPTRWYVATCPVGDIGAIPLCRYFEEYKDLPGKPNIRTVAELNQRRPDHWHKDPFDKAKMRGRPMLVSDNVDGPWCLLEGTHRLVEIHRLADAGTPPFPSLEVILGVSAHSKEWHWWRTQ